MAYRAIPGLSTLVLAVIFTGLWVYALHTTGTTPSWLLGLIAAAIIGACVIGVGAAMKATRSIPVRLFYVGGVVLILLGVASFCIFTDPTTINLFGALAIAIGMTAAAVSSAFLVACEPSSKD